MKMRDLMEAVNQAFTQPVSEKGPEAAAALNREVQVKMSKAQVPEFAALCKQWQGRFDHFQVVSGDHGISKLFTVKFRGNPTNVKSFLLAVKELKKNQIQAGPQF